MRDVVGLISAYWWLAPIVGMALVAYRFLGWRGLVAVLTLGGAAGLYRKGRTDEAARRERDEAEARSRAIKERQAIDDEVSQMDDPELDRDLAEWMRDNPKR